MEWVDIRHAWGRRETQKERAHLSDLGIDKMIIIIIIILLLFSRNSLECVDWIYPA